MSGHRRLFERLPLARLGARRGAIYVYTLVVSSLVATVAVAAIGLRRAELQRAEIGADSTQARVLAASGVDLAMRELASVRNWRTRAGAGAWSAWITASPGRVRYKLFDEIDGDLANDTSQPCRLAVQAEAGGATRYVSIELTSKTPTELISNGTFEAGVSPWTGTVPLNILTGTAPEGEQWLEIDRWLLGGTASIPVDGSMLVSGREYTFEGWLRADIDGLSCNIALANSGNLVALILPRTIAIGRKWQYYQTTLTPAWSGTLTTATLTVGSSILSTADIEADGLRLYDPTDTGPVWVAGTWRTETAASLP